MSGQPTTYTPEIGRAICDAIISSQDGLRKTLQAHSGLPPLATVEGWIRNNAQFSSDYADAKRRQIELMADDIIDISRDETLDPNDKRIRIDSLKWLLSKLIPKTYGDKLDLTSDGQQLGVASHVIDQRVQSIIMAARMRRTGQGQVTIEGLDDKALSLLE
jgi:hypothetical protein